MSGPAAEGQMIRAASGIVYDTRWLVDGTARRNAWDGLRGASITVTMCERIGAGETYFQFQLEDGRSFFLEMGGVHPPRCACRDNTNGTACKHIFWLWDQILTTYADAYDRELTSMSFVLLEDGRVTGPPESAGMDLIHANEIMDAILKRADNPRGWRILHRQAADDDRSETRTEEYEELEDRIEILCWTITPREAVKKEFSKCSSVNVDDEKILNDVFEGFKRLIQEFAANNQDFQTALGKILTTEFCISAELARMTLRYVEVFRRLDAASNPQSTQRSTDLKQGADMLKRIVEEIFEFYEDSVGTADHTWYVAGMLIEILRSVVERNYNMYERVQGAIANSSPQDNNLYVRLIGDPPAGNPQRFLVDMLFEQIPQKILVKHLSNLQSIGRILREHGGNNQYIQYFETNVAKLERSGAQGGSSRR